MARHVKPLHASLLLLDADRCFIPDLYPRYLHLTAPPGPVRSVFVIPAQSLMREAEYLLPLA